MSEPKVQELTIKNETDEKIIESLNNSKEKLFELLTSNSISEEMQENIFNQIIKIDDSLINIIKYEKPNIRSLIKFGSIQEDLKCIKKSLKKNEKNNDKNK